MEKYKEGLAIARKIRKIRAKRGLTLRDVGERANLTPAVISMIENGKISPTLTTLHKILGALGTGFGDFFTGDEAPAGQFHFPAGEMKKIVGRKRKYTLILPRRSDIKMQMVFEELLPGEKLEIETHEVDVAGFVLKGGPLKMEVIGKEERLIRKGDAFYISAGNPHQSSNIGKSKLEMVTCYYPPRY